MFISKVFVVCEQVWFIENEYIDFKNNKRGPIYHNEPLYKFEYPIDMDPFSFFYAKHKVLESFLEKDLINKELLIDNCKKSDIIDTSKKRRI